METPSPINVAEPKFYDNFLQERNIKWILGIGTAILLGSSLMLVTSQWGGFSAALKETIILGYTALIFAAGRYGYEKMALRRTGTVLLSLSVLLAPVACAALPWVWGDYDPTKITAYLVLLAAAGALTIRIGSRAFQHFLREPQPTLTAAYVVLALAGAIIPIFVNPTPWLALPLWGAFAVGVIKTNRRVFWLLEEQQRPRIFGFFPMMLLGAQFLCLFAAYFVGQTDLDWIGFGCVLTALPILLAADAVADVFQKRTGNLVRPLPWSILAPLAAGLVLATTGVVLSGVEVFQNTPYPLVPTSAMAAVIAGCIARRTGRREFVYAALALTTIAYRFLPVFFLETVRLVIASTADAIHESRLPPAFYGFTFVPLLTAFTAASVWCKRRGDALFAEPTKLVAVGLSMLFLVLAPTHEKALFPVAITLAAVFAMQARAFGNRLLVVPAIVAWFLAAAGLPIFAHGVLQPYLGDLPIPNDWFLCEIVAAALLLVPGFAIDRRMARLTAIPDDADVALQTRRFLSHPCRHGSLIMTGVLMFAWTAGYLVQHPQLPSLGTAGALAVLALAHAIVGLRTPVGIGSVLFANFIAGTTIVEHAGSLTNAASTAAAMLLTQWLISYLLAARPQWRISRAFGVALHRSSLCLLILVCSMGFGALQIWQIITAAGNVHPAYIIASLAMLAWLFDAARRERDYALGALAIVETFVVAAAALQTYAATEWMWLPGLLVAVAAALLPLVLVLRRYGVTWLPVTASAERIVPIVVAAVAFGTLGLFTTSQLVAGTAAIVVLTAWMFDARHPLRVQLPLLLLNWRLIGAFVAAVRPDADHLLQLLSGQGLSVCIPVAFACSLSALLWTILRRRRNDDEAAADDEHDLIKVHRLVLQGVGAYVLFFSVHLHYSMPRLDVASTVMAAATFFFYFVSELIAGCRCNDERRIWLAEGIAGLAVAYFAFFNLIHFGRGWSMYAVLAAGFALSFVAHIGKGRPAMAALVRPFTITGRLLPMATVILGVGRHIRNLDAGRDADWLGKNSLALLGAAAYYFHLGITDGLKRWKVLAAGILNVAVILLWNQLRLADPQFYMIPIGITILALVELLENEIPAAYRDPLRYAGALVILVSPTFHIVHGSWLHLFSLMAASVFVILAAIGLRVRALVYTGTAFLAADLTAMVVRGTIDNPDLLWAVGLGLGAGLLGLGALCELKREQVLQRVRAVGSALEAFK